MMFIPLRERVVVTNDSVAQGKQTYSRLKDVSPSEQMFHVNLFS